jgi:glycosyltransferase involved in cell wall biosynthesis
MTSANPLVSVIMPVYNGAKFLAEAVTSIRQQSYHPLEIVIVDDGSTDETAEIVKGLGKDIRYAYQRNSGPAAARNKGLEMARGEIITFLDVDDLWPPDKLRIQVTRLWPPDKLRIQVTRLVNDPNLDVVLGRIQLIKLPGAPEFQMQGPNNTQVNVHLGSGAFRKSVFDKVGVFDETLRYSEDHDWFLRAREQGISMTIVEQVTLHYRLHGNNMTQDKNAKGFQLTQVLKKSLDRRRQRGNGFIQSLPKISDFDEVRTSRYTDSEDGD